MSTVTVGQLCELFGQIAEGKTSGEALQELIERGQQLGLHKTLDAVFRAARKAAKEVSDPYSRSRAFAAIAGASRESKDFDEARKAAKEVGDAYWRSEAFAAIAGALARVIDA